MTLRTVSIIGCLICALVLASAYYLEYQYMLATCPLCILQRIVFMALGIVFILGVISKLPSFIAYIYYGVIICLSMIGAAIAGRQLWLQYFAPPQPVTCAASLSHLMNVYPFLKALKVALMGSGECAEIDFTIWGLSIAAWSFLTFAAICLVMFYMIFLQKKRRI